MIGRTFARLLIFILVIGGLAFFSSLTWAQEPTHMVLEGSFSMSMSASAPCVACVPPTSSATIKLNVDFETGSVSGKVSGQGSGQLTVNLCDQNGKPTSDQGTAQGHVSYSGSIVGTVDPQSGAISARATIQGDSSVTWVAGCPGCPVQAGAFTREATITGTVRKRGSAQGQISWASSYCSTTGTWTAQATSITYPATDTPTPTSSATATATPSPTTTATPSPTVTPTPTRPARVCDHDTICESWEGERCIDCPDCDCAKRAPFTACEPDPTNSSVPIGYIDGAGCYIPDVESYKAAECAKMEKDAQACVEAMLAFGMWQLNTGALGLAPYPITDPTIGLGTSVHKYLVQIGYLYEDGRESPYALQMNPMMAFQSYCNSRIKMYEAYCGKTWPSHRPLFDIKPNSNVMTTEEQIVMHGKGGIHYHGGPVTVVTRFGQTLYESEFAMEVMEDGTTVIHLIEGHALHFSFMDFQTVEFGSGETITIDPGGQVSPPAVFDVEALDRWWEGLEHIQVPGNDVVKGGGESPSAQETATPEAQSEAGQETPVPEAQPAATRESPTPEVTPQIPQEPVAPSSEDPETGAEGSMAVGIAVGSAFAVILVAVAGLVIWQVTRRRRLAPAGPSAVGPGDYLSVTRGQASRNFLPLDRPIVTIGRDPSSDLVVMDEKVSRQHAQIHQQAGAAVIHDLGSFNGTYVNGTRITGPCFLRHGDVVVLGQTELVFRSGTGRH